MEIETSDKETSNWMFEQLAGLRLESEGDPVGAPLFLATAALAWPVSSPFGCGFPLEKLVVPEKPFGEHLPGSPPPPPYRHLRPPGGHHLVITAAQVLWWFLMYRNWQRPFRMALLVALPIGNCLTWSHPIFSPFQTANYRRQQTASQIEPITSLKSKWHLTFKWVWLHFW